MTTISYHSNHQESRLGLLWRRWVVANAVSEALGLSLTLGLTALIMTRLEALGGIAGILPAFAAAVAAGVIEATLVGLAQWWAWLVLRRHVRHAGWWIPANMIAWAIAMPIIFWAVDLAYKMRETWLILPFALFVLLAVGGLVGAIHGAVLVRLVAQPSTQATG